MNPVKASNITSWIKGFYIALNKWLFSVFLRVFYKQLAELLHSALLPESKESVIPQSAPDWNDFIKSVMENREFQHRALSLAAPLLVRELYRGLLKREPDETGEKGNIKLLYKKVSLNHIINGFLSSEEFETTIAPSVFRNVSLPSMETYKSNYFSFEMHRNNAVTAQACSPEWYNILSHRYNSPAYVFLHIAKTGGTSLHKMLRDEYKARLFSDHANRLPFYLPAYLLEFDCFIGHFEHDTLRYLPKENKALITFVRSPQDRLLSIYNYYRAHVPNPSMPEVEEANNHVIEDFFRLESVRNSPSYMDHMTWCIMGNTQWQKWKALRRSHPKAFLDEDYVETHIRQKMRQRLSAFLFVGFFESYEESCDKLFALLGMRRPFNIIHENNLSQNVQTGSGFHKGYIKQTLPEGAMGILAPYVQLDSLLYNEAKTMFA